MKGTIEANRVEKITMSLLTHLFFDAVLALEKESSNQVVFSKQLAIRKCMKDVQEFILTHPYGIFSIEILNMLTRDLEDPELLIKFKNFGSEISEKVPMKYHIILDETYTTFEAYKSSIDGILFKMSV